MKCDQLPQEGLCTYVRHVTALATRGMSALVLTENDAPITVQADDRRACAEVLYRACVSLLVTLCDAGEEYHAVVRAHSLKILMADEASAGTGDVSMNTVVEAGEAASKRVFGLLGAIAAASSPRVNEVEVEAAMVTTPSLFAEVVLHLMKVVEITVETAAGAEHSSKQGM